MSNCGLCIGRGGHGANVLCSMLVCGFRGNFRGTRVVGSSSKHLRVATSGRRLCLRLCDNRRFRGLGSRGVGREGIPCQHRAFHRGRTVVRFGSSFGVISTNVVDGRSGDGSVEVLRTSVSSVGLRGSDIKHNCCGRTVTKACGIATDLSGRSALGVRGTCLNRCGMSDLCGITALVRGRGIVSATIGHTRDTKDS